MRLFKRLPDKSDSSHKRKTPSLILEEVINDLLKLQSRHILDLGWALAANLEFYSSLSAKICFEDLASTVSRRTAIIEDSALFEDLRSAFSGRTFNIILAWDLFNYLSREEVQELGAILARYSDKNTKLFSLATTQSHIPQTPRVFKIAGGGYIHEESDIGPLIPSPGYTKRDLMLLLPDFKLQRSVLLRDGTEEHLFSFLPK